jgi:hypothetical protein
VAGKPVRQDSGISSVVFTLVALVLIAGAVYWYVRYTASHRPQALELSQEAKEYVRNLKLSDVQIQAHESYVKQLIVEIQGKITNNGNRDLQVVEVICVFYDPYNRVVLRQRVPIVSARMGGLKPGETKSFRLPFDTVPEAWNHQLPQLVIAGIRF